MPIRIVYVPGPNPDPKIVTGGADPILVLIWDMWNDYSIRTTFGAQLIVAGTRHHLGDLRIMTSDEIPTSDLLDDNKNAPEGGKEFGFHERKYLALGANIFFYEQLVTALPNTTQREQLLAHLHDVVYLEHQSPTTSDLSLCKTDTFRISLLRGAAERKAYSAAREVLFAGKMNPDRFNFTLTVKNQRFTEPYTIKFDFLPERSRARPTNLTVLIGENGLGKTVTLVSIVECLIAPYVKKITTVKHHTSEVDRRPPFHSVIAVSYSPFETFQTAPPAHPGGGPKYAYCGFRKADETWGGFDYAWGVTFERLIEIVEYERDTHLHPGKPKFPHLVNVIAEGLTFDHILAQLSSNAPAVPASLTDCIVELPPGTRYLDLTLAVPSDAGATAEYLRVGAVRTQLYFRKKGQDAVIGSFSAGQAMFAFMVVGAIAAIDRESLLIIDEPELYLHPNLILSYLRMLAALLDLFQSYAVIATHSAYVVREVPARNVRIFQAAEGNTVHVDEPTMETFGADLIDITDLVFDTTKEKKAFEEWLKGLITNETDFEQLRKKYGKILNTENFTVLRNALEDTLKERAQGERP